MKIKNRAIKVYTEVQKPTDDALALLEFPFHLAYPMLMEFVDDEEQKLTTTGMIRTLHNAGQWVLGELEALKKKEDAEG